MILLWVNYRSTIQAITSFLDALQKIADAATNTKGEFYFTTRLVAEEYYWSRLYNNSYRDVIFAYHVHL